MTQVVGSRYAVRDPLKTRSLKEVHKRFVQRIMSDPARVARAEAVLRDVVDANRRHGIDTRQWKKDHPDRRIKRRQNLGRGRGRVTVSVPRLKFMEEQE